jgi:hypothetical protein
LTIKGRDYVLAISPEGLKLTAKGKRNGFELGWESLVSGEAALAVALQASVGSFGVPPSGPIPAGGSTDKVRRKAKAHHHAKAAKGAAKEVPKPK